MTGSVAPHLDACLDEVEGQAAEGCEESGNAGGAHHVGLPLDASLSQHLLGLQTEQRSVGVSRHGAQWVEAQVLHVSSAI